MRTFKFIIALLVAALTFQVYSEVSVNGFKIQKGINISHTLSQTAVGPPHPARDKYFREKDIFFIKNVGFDHIRMPIDEIEMWDDSGDKIPEAWEYLHDVIGWCDRHDLRIIIDLHTVRSHHFNAANEKDTPNTLWSDPAAQEVFLGLWKDISDELGKYENDFLAYELLNEAVAPTNEDWNELVAKTMKMLRKIEKERVIVIGSNQFQSYGTLPDLRVPENDSNIIVSFHFYDPFLVTHYDTYWNFMKDYKGPINYPGVPIPESEMNEKKNSKSFIESAREHNKEWNIDVINAAIEKAIEYAKQKDLPIYCGEWGCFVGTPRSTRVKLYKDTIAVFEKHNIARANWDYQGDFSVFDRDEPQHVDWEILNAITGK